MNSLQLGELSVISKQAGITFIWQGEEVRSVTVLNHQIEALRAFLDAHVSHERRVGFRVPLRPLSEAMRQAFDVRLKNRGKEHSTQAVDLSLTGILVEASDSDFKEGDQITATLCLSADCVSLNANVVRRNGNLVALHFPACMQNGELDPPESLLNIYRTLELEWLKSRVQGT